MNAILCYSSYQEVDLNSKYTFQSECFKLIYINISERKAIKYMNFN